MRSGVQLPLKQMSIIGITFIASRCQFDLNASLDQHSQPNAQLGEDPVVDPARTVHEAPKPPQTPLEHGKADVQTSFVAEQRLVVFVVQAFPWQVYPEAQYPAVPGEQ